MSPQKINNNNDILAIKILGEYSDLNKYIYIVFFIDKSNTKLLEIDFVISDDHKLLKFLNSYTNILELYKHIKFYNKLNTDKNNSSDKFKDVIMNILSEERNLSNMIVYQGNNNNISIIDIFSNSMNKFMDFHIGTFDIFSKSLDINDVVSAIDEVNKELSNFSNINISADNDDELKNDNDKKEEVHTHNYKLINASFIVDPIGGKSINDINPGDKVIVSINSNTVEENIIYLELKGKKDKYSKYLVPAEVLEKHIAEKSIKILLKLIDGYCCLIEELEPIKLKLFNPEKDLYKEQDNNNNNNKSSLEDTLSKINIFKLIMFGLSGILAFVLFAVLYMLFLHS